MTLLSKFVPSSLCHQNIRLNSLSSLQKYLVHFNLDSFKLRFFDKKSTDLNLDSQEIRLDLIRKSLESLGKLTTTSKSSLKSFEKSIKSLQSSLVEKITFFGVPRETAKSVLSSFMTNLSTKTFSMYDCLERALSRLDKVLRVPKDQREAFSVHCEGFHVLHYALTYDHRTVINIEEICCLDHYGNTICHFTGQDSRSNSQAIIQGLYTPEQQQQQQQHKHTNKHSSSENKHSFSKPRDIYFDSLRNVKARVDDFHKNEITSISSYCALAITYIVQDSKCGWGQGGHSLDALYACAFTNNNNTAAANDDDDDDQYHAALEGNLVFKTNKFVSILSPDDILSTSKSIFNLANIILESKLWNSKNLSSYLWNSKDSNFNLSIQSFALDLNFFLIKNQRFDANFMFSEAKLIASDLYNSNFKLPIFFSSFETFSLLDMNTENEYFPVIISRDPFSEATMFSIQSKVSSPSKDFIELKANLIGCDFSLNIHFLISLLKTLKSLHKSIFINQSILNSSDSFVHFFEVVSTLTISYEDISLSIPQSARSPNFLAATISSGSLTLQKSNKRWNAPIRVASEPGDEDTFYDFNTNTWKGHTHTSSHDKEDVNFPRIIIQNKGIALYTFISKDALFENHPTQNKKDWVKLTRSPFSKLSVLELPCSTDTDAELKLNDASSWPLYITRLLISDIENEFNSIVLDLSHFQYNLILDGYYNILNNTRSYLFESRDTSRDYNVPSTPKYGSKEYCLHLLEQPVNFETLISIKQLIVNCYIDKNELSRFTSLSSLLNVQNNYAVANISLKNIVTHLKAGGDTLRLACGLGGFELIDKRKPAQCIHPEVIKVSYSPDQIRYNSFADFDYGLTILPSFLSLNQSLDIPIKITCFYSKSTDWTTINVGLNNSDSNIKKMEIFKILSEFFALYFKNPNNQMYNDGNKEHKISYSAFDFRIFLYKPHLTIMKFPLTNDSETLMIETNNGIFCRYTVDSHNSYRIESQMNDLAIVIFKKYTPPNLSRGKRGISGSGFGVRTAVEFLCCSFAYHFDHPSNNIDFILNLCSASLNSNYSNVRRGSDAQINEVQQQLHSTTNVEENTSTKYVNLDAEFISSTRVDWANPTCIFPLQSSDIRTSHSSCDIVISYDDALFISNCFSEFIGDFTVFEMITSLFKDLDRVNEDTYLISNNTSPPDATTSNSAAVLPPSMYMILHLECVRLILVDDILGLHQPLLQCYLDNLEFCLASYTPTGETISHDNISQKSGIGEMKIIHSFIIYIHE